MGLNYWRVGIGVIVCLKKVVYLFFVDLGCVIIVIVVKVVWVYVLV